MLVQVRECKRCREEYPRLALRAVQFGGDDEFGFRERLSFGEMSAAAVGEQIAAVLPARAGDAIRIRPAQQDPGVVVRIGSVARRPRGGPLPLSRAALRLRLR